MQGKVYLYFFILCTIFPQGIFGKFLEDDVGESSNVLVREKRVISRIPGEDVPVEIGEVPYVVSIKKNRRQYCVGTILSHRTVITAARCVSLELRNYEVTSGSTVSYKGVIHNITQKAVQSLNPLRSSTFMTGIALINVSPPFEYRTTVFNIGFYTEPVNVGMIGTVSGWASFVYGGSGESKCAHRLRSINVSIMDHQMCRNIFRGHFPITDEDFCTHHPQRLCGYTDTGAPFVINNKLVGVHIGPIETEGRNLPVKPDVFVLLQNAEYTRWIHRNLIL